MVDESSGSNTDDEYRKEMIGIIRDRSSIPSSVLRRLRIQGGIDFMENVTLRREPNNPLYKTELANLRESLERIEDHKEEDRERDQNMITSADILDLHLSELTDFRRFKQTGVYSERTEELAKKVAAGLAWGIEADKKYVYPNTQYGKAGLPVPESDTMWVYRVDLLRMTENADIPGLLIKINHILSGIHDRFLPGMPNRDLIFEPWRVEGFLSFLSNDLR